MDDNSEHEQASPARLPRFLQAEWQARRLYWLLLGLGNLCGLLIVIALVFDVYAADSIGLPVLCNISAVLLVLIAMFQSAWGVTRWRAAALLSMAAPSAGGADGPVVDSMAKLTWLSAGLDRLAKYGQRVGTDALWIIGLSLLALLMVFLGWRLAIPSAGPGRMINVGAGLLLLSAVALVLFERYLASLTEAEWPEAAVLGPFLRVAIAVALLCALCLWFSDASLPWPAYLAMFTGLLPALVALEIAGRALFSLFYPQRPGQEPRLIGASFIAGQLRWPPQSMASLQEDIKQRFGIDLRQVWAFSFMRRAFAPVLILLMLVAWMLTGVSEVAVNGRGIYERFGKPAAVWVPGLHVGLPWPFGRVLPVENGEVHELTTLVAAGEAHQEPVAAEGDAPQSANRLWDGVHGNEKSQVIASDMGNAQSFQIVDMDVRFIYRVGLTDTAALASAYNSADIPSLIRSTANQILVREFASLTLDGVLGSQRAGLADNIHRQVQDRLDALNSGVEMLAIVIEAIHPPAGAANAYHGVQAAQIAAQALVAREGGNASALLSAARLDAGMRADRADAGAHENIAGARAAELRFTAQRQAWRTAGQAFLSETYFSRLSQALANTPMLLLDHRISAGASPTLDLRNFSAPIDAGAAGPDVGKPQAKQPLGPPPPQRPDAPNGQSIDNQ